MTDDNQHLSPTDRQLLGREAAADRHIDGSGYYNERMREVFCTGWDAAMEWVKQQDEEARQEWADGRYCRHRDADPAHSAICYQQGL